MIRSISISIDYGLKRLNIIITTTKMYYLYTVYISLSYVLIMLITTW